ncbi:aminopeptidase N [Rudaeicoccus suwonensis]|uniref:Aminopeptidase N n=1 Tax=Rudaeicoccus suwonensis TaxID=657409 RepID=A0A561ECV3_9MICO|nr:aminopeptidase N [Rudaeicoccus suwonensis]TWE13432.1 aminopeptidase N [Rudaeicoccus suwonensis]
MPATNLTREEAQQRATAVSVESYDVALDLTTGASTFPTRSQVRFTASPSADGLFIDFIGPSVEAITLNGESIDPATHFDGARISLPSVAADNTLVIEATGAYMNTGEGLHRFVDPADDEVYLYTQFEVADCRRVFAVFDQPDLKATFAFTVTAPARWQIISNQPTPAPQPADATYVNVKGESEPTATWRFEPTPRLASYVTALVAGPYAVVRDQVEAAGGTIPLGLFCRESQREHLDAESLFDTTKRGFEFFERTFDEPYPFAKYDQIFTPEFNAGAMENAGCVTITDTYIFRTQVAEAIVERRALTVLHELAHMWFGDLVTMRWWDDLWLNESFAEWASSVCQAEATQWDTAWTTFAASEKTWAYRQDQQSSTHPVYANMRHLEDVEANFDGITYAKGASVLKQLVSYVGRDPFVAGLRSYFNKFKWGNTTFDDLLGELEQTSGRDLGSWNEQWLRTCGVNTLRPVVDTDADGVITRFVIEQTAAAEYPVLRTHRLAIGCYELQDGHLVRTDSVETDVDGSVTEVSAMTGRRRPDLLLINDQDLTYGKVRLDDSSLAVVLQHPTGIPDSLTRAVVQGALWDMARDGELGARRYIAYAMEAVAAETDSSLRQCLLMQVTGATTVFLTSGAAGNLTSFVRPEHRSETADHVATSLRSSLIAAAPGSDAQLQLVQSFARMARRDTDVAYIRGLLEGTTALAGLTLDTDMRWTLLASLAAAGVLDDTEVENQLAADRTATGIARAAGVRATYPTAAAKQQAWHDMIESDALPNETVRAVALGFGRVHDTTVLEPYVELFHAALLPLWEQRTFAIASSLVQLAYPIALASPALLEASQRWLDENPEAPAGLRRLVAENRDIVQVAVTAQEHDA